MGKVWAWFVQDGMGVGVVHRGERRGQEVRLNCGETVSLGLKGTRWEVVPGGSWMIVFGTGAGWVYSEEEEVEESPTRLPVCEDCASVSGVVGDRS